MRRAAGAGGCRAGATEGNVKDQALRTWGRLLAVPTAQVISRSRGRISSLKNHLLNCDNCWCAILGLNQ